MKSSISSISNYVRENEMLHISDQIGKYINPEYLKTSLLCTTECNTTQYRLTVTVHSTQYNIEHGTIL